MHLVYCRCRYYGALSIPASLTFLFLFADAFAFCDAEPLMEESK